MTSGITVMSSLSVADREICHRVVPSRFAAGPASPPGLFHHRAGEIAIDLADRIAYYSID